MTQGSKLTQNMAVTVLLGLITVGLSPLPKPDKNTHTPHANTQDTRKYGLNIAGIDGMKFECPRPLDESFSPTVLVEKEREREKENREKVARRSSCDMGQVRVMEMQMIPTS